MTADGMIRREGHPAVLLLLDFPETANIGLAQAFAETVRSRAVTFRQRARHYRSAQPDRSRALAGAASRHNLRLEAPLP